MNGLNNLSRRISSQEHNRRHRAPSSAPISDRIDVGDWSLAQDADGHLIIHNVKTGNRIIVARAEVEEVEGE